jgi:arylsulfatase A-like enzyme
MGKVRNVVFVMCDQLRHDYLSCSGHPTIGTSNIDAFARRGVRFDRAFVQSPVCGPSRMSFYTGRYVASHGATWNGVPLRVGEPTAGDWLRPLGLEVALCGKTHMRPDLAGLERLAIESASDTARRHRECGFDAFIRDDGLHPDQHLDPSLAYNEWLRGQGYAGANPWHEFANSAEGPDGEVLSGWLLRHSRLPARVAEPDSETAWMTDRAISFMESRGDRPFLLHLSYIKPHWPYIAPAPYHAMFGPNHILPRVASPRELENPHPVHAAFMQHGESLNFSRDDMRRAVVPTYMGLIRQIDDHLGRLWNAMDRLGRWVDTLVVLTSDHGDYLGDHWLGEKELFHEQSVRVPLIIHDPDPTADATRGLVRSEIVEAIDLLPTFLDALGGAPAPHVLEGRSLLPLLRGGDTASWRDAAFSELDYAFRHARLFLGLPVDKARAWMVRTDSWKYVFHECFRPQLFDLRNDPDEFTDVGDDPAFEAVRADMQARLFSWLRNRRMRITLTDEEVARRTGTAKQNGYLIGVW